MRLLLPVIVLVCAGITPSGSQSASEEYQMGTIVAVARHLGAGADADILRYDVSVRIRNMIYVVLYTPPNGAQSVEQAAGRDMLFLVGKDTLTFTSRLTGTTASPILRRETLPNQPTLDWSKLPSQYFSLILQHLSESLDLSPGQRSQIKPIIEQEAGEATRVCFTSVLTVQDRLNRWEMIVHSSDEKMKSVLSQPQWQQLQAARSQQKQELKEFITQQKPENSGQ